MLRRALLFLSEQRHLRAWMETSAAAGRLTKRFIAGQSLEQELEICRQLNRDGIRVTVDHLGEKVTSAEEARASLGAYLEALQGISAGKLDASISIKLSQFGLEISDQVCLGNVETLMQAARDADGFVEMDMESHEYVDRNLRIVSAIHGHYGRVRAVIQAYLYRSEEDVAALVRLGVPVRLCKGAYREPASVALPRKSQVNANYRRLSEMLLEHGANPALATHDPQMISHALDFAGRRGIRKDAFEFQMLYGIRRDLQERLLAEGWRLRLYVPYGNAWYPYLMRRLAERPANLVFLARNLVRR